MINASEKFMFLTNVIWMKCSILSLKEQERAMTVENNSYQSTKQEVITPGLEPFVATFFEDRKNEFLQIKAHIADQALEPARKLAHNWKGFCEPYGFGHLGVMAAELEKSIVAGNTENINNLVLAIELYLANKKLPSEAAN